MTLSCRLLCIVPVAVLLVAALACGSAATPVPSPVSLSTVPAASASPSPAANVPTSLWYLTRGGAKADLAWGVDVDAVGNIYLGAYQQAEDQWFTEMVIYKFAPDGTELWQSTWGRQYQDKTFIVTVSEPYVFVGGLVGTGAGLTEADMAILALNAQDGSLVWEYTWGQGYGYEEVDGLVADGDYLYASGWTTGETTGNDLAILKLDRQGNLIWAQTWGTAGWDQADGQMVVNEDTIYVAGRYDAPNAVLGGKALVAQFSKETGAYIAHQTWGDTASGDALGMTGDGTYLYVVGLTTGFGNGGQIFVLKIDEALNLIWQQLWGGPAGEAARVIAVDAAGNILVAGHTDSYGNGANDIVLLQFSPDGQLNWSQTWGGPETDSVEGMMVDGSSVYLAGNTNSFGRGQNDALLIKADAATGMFPPLQ